MRAWAARVRAMGGLIRRALGDPRWWSVGRRRWWGAGLAVLVLAAGTTWLAWPDGPQPRARQYRDYNSCLLTGERGLADPAAAPVWAGMQEASLATLTRVQYLAISGPQTTDNGLTYVASLAQSRCGLVFGAGAPAGVAIGEGAARFPDIRFVVVGGGTSTDNLTYIDTTEYGKIKSAISATIKDAVRSANVAGG